MVDTKKNVYYIDVWAGALLLFGLYLTSLYSYLLFHSLAEVFSVVVGCGIFIIAINSRQFVASNYFLFIGIGYLFISGLDFMHTLAYKGMGVFQGYGANLPTQLWIVSRYAESLTLLIAPLLIGKKLNIKILSLSYTVAISLSLGAIFYWNVFPDCFTEGVGLTLFKKISEYIISLILLVSIFLLLQKRREFQPNILRLLIASIIITIASELAFTFYISVYSLSNLIGHVFKILSFYLIYKAIIETGLTKPYHSLFKNLKQNENRLEMAIEATGLGIYEHAVPLGNNTYHSKRWAEILGYQLEELPSPAERLRWVLDQVKPEDLATIQNAYLGFLEGRTPEYEVEIRMRHKSGRWVWVRGISRAMERDDDEHVTRVLGVTEDITKRKQAEEAFTHRLEFEKCVSVVSARFVNVSDIDDAINASLGDIGRVSGTSRAYLFLFRENGSTMDNTHEWCAEGVEPQKDNLQDLPFETVPWWMAKLRKGEVIQIQDVSKMPAEAKTEQEILESQDIKSLLVLPLYIGGELAGFIGFDNIRETGAWNEEDLALLRLSSEIIGRAIQRERAEAQLRGSRRQLRELSAHLQSVREEEKTHIAREVHDELGQTMTALKMDLRWLRNSLSEEDAEASSPLLEKIKSMSEILDATIQSVQRIATELRPEVLDDFGLVPAIEWHVEEFQNRTGIQCKVTFTFDQEDAADVTLDAHRSMAMFRLFQEALTNVARHANATRVEIHLKEDTGNIILAVKDNGAGISESEISNPKSLGLLGMRERALLLGGTLEISGIPGAGTTVTLLIPLSISRKDYP